MRPTMEPFVPDGNSYLRIAQSYDDVQDDIIDNDMVMLTRANDSHTYIFFNSIVKLYSNSCECMKFLVVLKSIIFILTCLQIQ